MRQNIDDIKRIVRIDKSNMIVSINQSADFLAEAAGSHRVRMPGPSHSFENLVLMGMGGSASAGDVLSEWLGPHLKIPVLVSREPALPNFVGRNTLFVGISYSGDTGETLSAFREARNRGCSVAAVGSGGKLGKLSGKNGLPFFPVISKLAPRAALAPMVGAGAVLLEALGVVSGVRRGLREAGKELDAISQGLRATVPSSKNRAKAMALRLWRRFPVVYCLQRMSSVGRRAKNQFAENSKVFSKFDVLPEAGHNEVEAWHGRTPANIPVLIRDSSESGEEKAVFDAFKAVLRKAGHVSPLEVRTRAVSPLGRILGPVLFLDYVSVYLALLSGVDPSPTLGIRDYRRIYSGLRG